jgi:redox-sensitive bicupin YhaK (pirin superfamily)
MITIRRAAERGHFDFGWLDTFHTFSFGDYYDAAHMGFRDLRVINEDRVQPGQGFPTHGHRDMEIVTWIVEGALQHRDSLGTGSVIRPGEVQRMTAGTGVTHSEFNASHAELVHLLQIWILPEAPRLEPSYEQKSFPAEGRRGKWQLVASRDGRDGSVTVHQDVRLSLAQIDPGQTLEYALAAGRHAWLQVVWGEVPLDGQALDASDGAAISDQPRVAVAGRDHAEVMLFDLR